MDVRITWANGEQFAMQCDVYADGTGTDIADHARRRGCPLRPSRAARSGQARRGHLRPGRAVSAQDRACGACQACCTAITTWDKGRRLFTRSGDRCPFQCAEGCGIYSDRPRSCAAYACRWLEGWGRERDRPDRLGLIVESSPDDCPPSWVVTEAAPGAADKARARRLLAQLGAERPVLLCRFKRHGADPAPIEFSGTTEQFEAIAVATERLKLHGAEGGMLTPRRDT